MREKEAAYQEVGNSGILRISGPHEIATTICSLKVVWWQS